MFSFRQQASVAVGLSIYGTIEVFPSQSEASEMFGKAFMSGSLLQYHAGEFLNIGATGTIKFL